MIDWILVNARSLKRNTLYMNALYLLLSTIVVAATGFVFWLVVTRSYDSGAVGLATTLLSVSSLLSLLGLAGFDVTFVRFLPKAANKNAYINSGFIVVAVASGGLAPSMRKFCIFYDRNSAQYTYKRRIFGV